jgi:tetratricopeptide (TPR) repeat protein
MRMLVICLLLVGGAARADDDRESKRAQEYLKAGVARFEKGLYKEALATFKRGFEHKPLPALRFHLGECYRRLGDASAAEREYRAYLAAVPDAPERTQVVRYLSGGDRPAATTTAEAPPVDAKAGRAQTKESVLVVDTPAAKVGQPKPFPAVAPEKAAPPTEKLAAPPAAVATTATTKPAAASSDKVAATTPAPVAAESPVAPAEAPAAAKAEQPRAPDQAHADLTAPAPADEAAEAPVYKKWWLWTGVGGQLAVFGVAVGLGMTVGSPAHP